MEKKTANGKRKKEREKRKMKVLKTARDKR